MTPGHLRVLGEHPVRHDGRGARSAGQAGDRPHPAGDRPAAGLRVAGGVGVVFISVAHLLLATDTDTNTVTVLTALASSQH